jgi:hypothetical protein
MPDYTPIRYEVSDSIATVTLTRPKKMNAFTGVMMRELLDVFDVIDNGWDLMVCHPPCTHLSVSGARHFAAKQASGVQQEALAFVGSLLAAPIPMIALENPISIISSHFRKPDQIIQPWMFGHGETKATCLWLKGLPKLTPTNIVDGREARVHRMPPSPDRWKLRSTTYQGIADAMASQWGRIC